MQTDNTSAPGLDTSRRDNPFAQTSSFASDTLAKALEEYDRLCRTGRRPDREAFLASHAEVARELADCLDGLDMVLSLEGNFSVSRNGSNASEGLSPSTELGDFRILREVGRGGMGVVYEAEQLSLGRRVALKVLLASPALDPRQRQRFQIEAQAAALLHHQHIVPVFGIGSHQGVPYYAMQFIEGKSLAEVIWELRRCTERNDDPLTEHTDKVEPALCDLDVLPWNASATTAIFVPPLRQDFRTAAWYICQAADALDHAHKFGVIHRDIKPSNLLLDARGHLWVTDFGLARIAQGDLGLTRTGDLLGTLRYMSPEQVRGDADAIDPRVDIYALGVTLYELLTLNPFFNARDRSKLLQRILHDEPVVPRRLNAAIPRDLETIVLKAVAKDAGRRYQSAADLRDDLRRFLDDQPIAARRPSLPERAFKWSRRHRSIVVATASVLLVALFVSTVVLWEARSRTNHALEQQRKARMEELLAFHLSLGTIEQIAQSVEEDGRQPPRSAKERSDDAQRIALAFYDRIAKTFASDEMMQEVTAKALRAAGRVRLSQGNSKGYADYTEAVRVYAKLADQQPSRIWLFTGLLETLCELAGILEQRAERADAERHVRHAVRVAEALIGNRDAARPCFRTGLVEPFRELAWRLSARPGATDADAALAVRFARQATDWDPDRADLWSTLGVALYRTGDHGAARAAFDKAVALSRGGSPTDCFFLALLAQRDGDVLQARRLYNRAVADMNGVPHSNEALHWFQAETSHALSQNTPLSPMRPAPPSLVSPPAAPPIHRVPPPVKSTRTLQRARPTLER